MWIYTLTIGLLLFLILILLNWKLMRKHILSSYLYFLRSLDNEEKKILFGPPWLTIRVKDMSIFIIMYFLFNTLFICHSLDDLTISSAYSLLSCLDITANNYDLKVFDITCSLLTCLSLIPYFMAFHNNGDTFSKMRFM